MKVAKVCSKLLMVLATVVLLSACASIPEEILQTAEPTMKPPPTESQTIIVGHGLDGFVGAVLVSAVIAAVVVTLVAFVLAQRRYLQERALSIPSLRRVVAATILLFGALVILQVLRSSLVTVPADKVGVRLRYGAAQDEVLTPGLHQITPWADQIALLSTREFTYITTSHVEEASEDFTDFKVGARTCDGVEVEIPYTIKFKIQPASAPRLFAEYGSVAAVEERVVKALSRQIVREVPTNFSSVALYASSAIIDSPDLITDEFLRGLLTEVACGERSTGFDKLNEQIRGELAGEFERVGVVLTFFGVRQPDLGAFGEKLDEVRIVAKDAEIAQANAVTAEAEKQIEISNAEARAEAARIATVRSAEAAAEARQREVETEAETLQLLAEAQAAASQQESVAEAQSIRVRAEAEADALLVRATAEAEANRELASSLTPELSRHLQAIAMSEVWDGRLPAFGELSSVMPFIDLTPIITGTVPPVR